MFCEVFQNAAMERTTQNWRFLNLQFITNLDSLSVQEAQLFLLKKKRSSKLLFKSYYFNVGNELSLNSSHLQLIKLDAGDLLLSHRWLSPAIMAIS